MKLRSVIQAFISTRPLVPSGFALFGIVVLFLQVVSIPLSANPAEAEWLRTINTQRDQSLDGFFGVVTDLAPWIAFILPSLIMVYFFVRRNRTDAVKALSGLVAVSLAALTTTILKFWIDRPRPFVSFDFIEKLSVGGSPSFPSGHTTDAFAMAIVLTLLTRRWWIALPAFFWAALVGYSRMHLGVHYPSDVLAGSLIGVIVAGVTFRVIDRKFRKAWKKSPAIQEPLP